MILTLCFLVFKCFLSFRFSHKVTLRREVIFIELLGGFEGVRFMKMKLSGIHCFWVVVCPKTHVDPLFKEFLVYFWQMDRKQTYLKVQYYAFSSIFFLLGKRGQEGAETYPGKGVHNFNWRSLVNACFRMGAVYLRHQLYHGNWIACFEGE